MKKVLIITYYWPPAGGPGVQRWMKFVKYFSDYKILPFVVTVNPNKASYPILDHSLVDEFPKNVEIYKTNTYEFYSAYKVIYRKKQIPFSGFANQDNPSFYQKVSRFIRGNFFIPDPRTGWNKYAIKKCSEIIEKEDIKFVITTSPPHSTQLIGLALQQKYHLPWIADLRDPWTDIYYYDKFYHTGWAKKRDMAYEKQVLVKADKIIVVSNEIKKIFSGKSNKINEEKIHIIPNGFDEMDFCFTSKPPKDKFVITYTGTLNQNYNPDIFFKILSEICSKHNNINFVLRFVGNVSENILKKLKKTNINVEAVSQVKHAKSIEYLMNSTILFLSIPNTKNNEGILTGKLFEYLAAKKPIVCIGPPNGGAAKIISDCNAGKVFDYNDEDEKIKQYLQFLLNKWMTNTNLDLSGNTHMKFSRKELTCQLVEILNSLN